jgi:predicted metalloprotease
VATACGSRYDDVRVSATAAPTTTTTSTTTTTTVPRTTTTARSATTTTVATSGGNTPQAYQSQLAAIITDIQSYWRTTFKDVYKKTYKDLKGGVFRAYPGVANIPACVNRPTNYRTVRGNAFYCRDGSDFIAYDDASLFPRLSRLYGVMALGLVLAHEWGHAIQYRANVDGETILLEQQADCFAGGWMAHIGRGEAPGLALGPKDLTSALAGMLSFSDPAGITPDQQGAHGSGFDRIGAFEDGYTNGPAKCATYPQTPPPVFELPFNPGDNSSGNLDYDKVVPSMGEDLDRYWADVFQKQGKTFAPLLAGVKKYVDVGPFPACGTDTAGNEFKGRVVEYCPAGDYVAYNDDELLKANDSGDFAAGIFVSGAWADAAQSRLGSKLTAAERSLQQDCYSGSWAGSIIDKGSGVPGKLSLSPGDLDEAIIAFVDMGSLRDPIGGPAVQPFDRVAALRKGVLQGIAACG